MEQVTAKVPKKNVSINPVLERELPPLDAERLSDLRVAIRRDGVLDAIKVWHNPVTGKDEIIDGHHRYKIANEINISYDTKEIDFDGKTITAVKYWMHVNQSARRGGSRNLKRMTELWLKMTGEPKADAIKAVAKDAGVSERAVQRATSKAEHSKPDIIAQITRLIAKLTDDQKEAIRSLLK